MIHNISIATGDDIIQLGDDVNINLNWLEKTIVKDHNFCQFLVN